MFKTPKKDKEIKPERKRKISEKWNRFFGRIKKKLQKIYSLKFLKSVTDGKKHMK